MSLQISTNELRPSVAKRRRGWVTLAIVLLCGLAVLFFVSWLVFALKKELVLATLQDFGWPASNLVVANENGTSASGSTSAPAYELAQRVPASQPIPANTNDPIEKARKVLDEIEAENKRLRERSQELEQQLRLSTSLASAVRQGVLRLVVDEASGTSLELVFVPPCAPPSFFLMGRTDEERIAANSATNGLFHNDSFPQHPVAVLDAFFLGRFEVTYQQYYYFFTARNRQSDAVKLPDEFSGSMPVHSISWQDAKQFCLWLSEKNPGYSVRLPTEVEWEYAARGRGRTRFARADNDAKFDNRTFEQGLAPVGGPAADESWCGACNMSGNVGEWCVDLYDENTYTTVLEESQPFLYRPIANPPDWVAKPLRTNSRVFRGGFFGDATANCEAATRRWKLEDTRKDYLGFRVAVVLPDGFGQSRSNQPVRRDR